MGDPEVTAKKPVDPTKLCNKELVSLFCANRKEQALAAEIWQRYGGVLRDSLKSLIFRQNGFCPRNVDRRTFLDSAFSRAYLNLFARICGLRDPDSPRALKGWLRCVARTAAFDEYRWLTRSRDKIIELGLGEVAPDDVGGMPEDDSERQRRPFRTKLLSFYGRAQKIPPPDTGIQAQERKFVLREALVRYSRTSDEAAESARAIRLWCAKGWSMVQIGAYFFGDSLTASERNRKEKAVERELKRDTRNLRGVLRTEFGITSAGQI